MRRLSAVRPARAREESAFFLPYLTLGFVLSVSASNGCGVGRGLGAGGAGGVGGGGAGDVRDPEAASEGTAVVTAATGTARQLFTRIHWLG